MFGSEQLTPAFSFATLRATDMERAATAITTECRIANDGRPYTYEEFLGYYGSNVVKDMWDVASQDHNDTDALQFGVSASGAQPHNVPPVQSPAVHMDAVGDSVTVPISAEDVTSDRDSATVPIPAEDVKAVRASVTVPHEACMNYVAKGMLRMQTLVDERKVIVDNLQRYVTRELQQALARISHLEQALTERDLRLCCLEHQMYVILEYIGGEAILETHREEMGNTGVSLRLPCGM